MFNSLLNTLWPVKELVEFIFTSVFSDCVSCDVSKEDVEKEIKSRTFCEIFNLEIMVEGFNKRFFNLAPIEFIRGSIDKFYLKFPKNYFKEKLEFKLENIDLVISDRNIEEMDLEDLKKNLSNSIKNYFKASNKLPNPIQKIINNIINNLEIEIKNINIKYMTKSLEQNYGNMYSPHKLSHTKFINIYLGSILYTKLKENTKEALFLFNKQIIFYDFFIKILDEKSVIEHIADFNTKDVVNSNIFENKLESIADKNCIMISEASYSEVLNSKHLVNYQDLNSSFWLKFEKDDTEKDSINIETNFNKLEIILTKNQFEFIYIITKRLDEIKSKIYKISQDIFSNGTLEKSESIDYYQQDISYHIFTHKISKIKHNVNFNNFNCILLENITTEDLAKPKIWLIFDHYFKKYYMSFDDKLKDNFNTNVVENIQRHFSYLEDNYFLLNAHKLNLKSKYNLIHDTITNSFYESSITVSDINIRYIEPNNRAIKKEFVLIKNLNGLSSEAEKFFDEKFGKIFMNSMRYGYSLFNIASMDNIDIKLKLKTIKSLTNYESIKSTEIFFKINEMKIDFNVFIFLKIYYFILSTIKRDHFKSKRIKNAGPCNKDLHLQHHHDSLSLEDKVKNYQTCVNLPIQIGERSSEITEKYEENIKDKFHTSPPINDFNLNKELNVISEKKINSSENRLIFSGKISITFSQFLQGNQLFKEFYNTFMHFSSDSTNNYNPRRIFKIGDNISNKENFTMRLSPLEIILYKKSGEIYYNLFSDFDKIFLFYFKNTIYFPILIYTNSKFFSVESTENLDFKKIYEIKNWTIMFINKNYNDTSTYEVEITEDIKSAMNLHKIKNKESFLFDQINSFYVLRNMRTSKGIGISLMDKISKRIQINLNKIDFFINVANVKELIDLTTINVYYFKYFRIFMDTFQNKFKISDSDKSEFTSKFLNSFSNISFNLELNEINIFAFSNFKSTLDLVSRKENFLNYNLLGDNFLNSINYSEKYFYQEGNIFNLIEDPFIKLQLSKYYCTAINISQNKNFFINSLENFKVMIRKKNQKNYHDIKLKYQIYFENINEDENFENILHKGTTNKKNLLSMLINYKTLSTEEKDESSNPVEKGIEHDNFEDFIRKFLISQQKNNQLKITSFVTIDDLVFCPLFYSFEECSKMISNLHKEKFRKTRKHSKTSNLERSIYSFMEDNKTLKNELRLNEKLFELNESNQGVSLDSKELRYSEIKSISSKNNQTNSFASISKSKWDFSINLRISRLVLDLYSHVENKNKLNTKIEVRDKMRLITEIEQILYEDSVMESIKDLNIQNPNMMTSILPSEAHLYPRLMKIKISKIYSIFLKNLDYSNYAISSLLNKCQHISKENSYWKKVGFAEIMNLDNIEINLNKITTNFKTEIIMNLIEFNFCKDSWKYFDKFIHQTKKNVDYLKSQINEKKEIILKEEESLNDKSFVLTTKNQNLNDQENLKGLSKKNGSITFKNVNSNSKVLKSADIKRKPSDFYLIDFNLNSKTKDFVEYPQSFNPNEAENLLILDKNYEKMLEPISFDKDKRQNFHSESVCKTQAKDGESCIQTGLREETEMNEDMNKKENNKNVDVINPKESVKQINERLNLLILVNNFKFYLIDGKDFLFEDRYTDSISITEHNSNENIFENNEISMFRPISEEVKSQVDCNVIICVNPNSIIIIEDYMISGEKNILESNKKKEEINKQISNHRIKKIQRNYSSYVCLNAENIELRLFLYK